MMSWLKRAASPATLIAMLALVAAVVGTAIAGPRQSNTAKTAKKALRLAKNNQKRINRIQLTPGPQGPQGGPGSQGLQGLQGLPGPTFAGTENTADPVANPDGKLFPVETNVNTPAPGRLLVMFSGANYLEINCSAGLPTMGLYVDGDPVPDTRRDFNVNGVLSAAEAAPGDFGVTATAVPAGEHVIKVFANCPGGALEVTGAAGFSLGAILLSQ
jgi:hypothetical protein